MKQYLKTLILALFAALLWAGCADEEPQLDNQQQVDILSRFNSEGKAWMSLEIPVGKIGMTRAISFDDGSEYQVRDAYILLFAGTSESTAKFASAYNVTPAFNNSPEEQISVTAIIPINDTNINTGDNLYAFVLLNNNSSAITAQTLTSVTFANNGSAVTLTGGTSTVANLQDVTITNYVDGNYFLMTNAVLADKPGGSNNPIGANVIRLAQVPASFFFHTQEEAEANPAGHINVERLAVKTTVESGLGSGDMTVKGNANIDFAAADFSFALDNYNTASYALKHVDSNWLPYNAASKGYRFVEQRPVESFQPLVYRTYWAQDANYSGNSANNGLTFVSHETYMTFTSAQRTAFWKPMGTSNYCAENTFDVSHMQDDCTTSVLVRLQLNGGLDFYTTSVTGQDVVFQPPLNEVTEEGTSADQSFARRRSNKVTYDGTNYATIDDYLREWLWQTNSDFRAWVNNYAGGNRRHVNIAVTTPQDGGVATATVTQTAQASGSTGATVFTALDLDSYLSENITLYFYDDGYCFYRVPIMHFGTTDQTPWSSTPSMEDNSTAQAYQADGATTAEQRYLGRYGVVRNNWYTINITSVTHVGSPTIPPLTQDADDRVEQLLNAVLNISSWTTKNQDL